MSELIDKIEDKKAQKAEKGRTRVDALMEELLSADGRVKVTAEVDVPITIDQAHG